MMRLTEEYIGDVRISGDSSKVFYLKWGSIQAWSTLTGEVVGKVDLDYSILRGSCHRTLFLLVFFVHF